MSDTQPEIAAEPLVEDPPGNGDGGDSGDGGGDQGEGGENPQAMTFLQHLGELRERLVKGVVFIIIGAGVGWYFAGDLYEFMLQPLCKALGPDQCQVYPREMLEVFFVFLKTGLLAGLVITAPLWMHQAWAFIAPGLFPHEKRYALHFGIIGGALFIAGSMFGFFVVFPNMFSVMATYTNVEWLQYLLSMKNYARLTTTLALGFGVLFQTPVAIVFLSMLGVVTPDQLSKNRGIAIVVILLIVAIITPTVDPLTFIAMAAPIWLLFEIGILMARSQLWIRSRFAPREGEETQADYPDDDWLS